MDMTSIDLDWEEWKKDIPFWHHAVAGSCAGITEHIALFPLDTLKTNVQAYSSLLATGEARPPLHRIFRDLIRQNGVRGLFRGWGAISSGCIPAHAALFSMYEVAKSRIGTEDPLNAAICGALSTFSHDAILTPVDVVKQRLQLGCYRSTWDCVRTVSKQEGVSAFFRSMPTTLGMNLPFGAIFVSTNEWMKRRLRIEECLASPDRQNVPPIILYFLSAGVAGGVAGAITNPLDVIKTRLQTQDVKESVGQVGKAVLRQNAASRNVPHLKYSGFISSLLTILREEGIRGFWRGTSARTLLSIPSAAICWGTYECAKVLLWRVFGDQSKKPQEKEDSSCGKSILRRNKQEDFTTSKDVNSGVRARGSYKPGGRLDSTRVLLPASEPSVLRSSSSEE